MTNINFPFFFLLLLNLGGDEARVARAGGSGASCCSSTLANGTSLLRALPPRAAAGTTSAAGEGNNWQQLLGSSISSSSSKPPTLNHLAFQQQWASQKLANHYKQQQSQSRIIIPSTAGQDASLPGPVLPPKKHQQNWQWSSSVLVDNNTENHQHQTLMSQNVAASPPSRPPSSASSTTSSSSRHHHHHHQPHDHSRPLPPPRLPVLDIVTTLPSSSIPSSPRPSPATTSFRSASRVGGVTLGTTTTTTTISSSSSISPRPGTAVQLQPAEVVSLEVPRPDVERIANEYVETPFRPAVKPTATDAHQIKPSNHQRSSCKQQQQHQQQKSNKNSSRSSASTSSSTIITTNQRHRGGQQLDELRSGRFTTTAITKQPLSFTKEPSGLLSSNGSDTPGGNLSIMCDDCGRCRCESCREPPPLPSRWVCDNSCLCSPESVIDYASCLCCVKGVFYHCADGVSLHNRSKGSKSMTSSSSSSSSSAAAIAGGDESNELGSNCADEPCSCTGSRKTLRWTFMGAMALFLPCLLCYWPLRGCLCVCEACYAKHASQGCRCEPRSNLTTRQALAAELNSTESTLQTRSQLSEALMRDPEKRLLDPLGSEL